MSDEMDRVQAINEQHIEDCLAEHKWRRDALHRRDALQCVSTHTATIHCIECDDEIPEARRRAVPGCRRCVCCQERFEIHRRDALQCVSTGVPL